MPTVPRPPECDRAGQRSAVTLPRWQVTAVTVGQFVVGGAAAVAKWPHAWWWLVVAAVAAAALTPREGRCQVQPQRARVVRTCACAPVSPSRAWSRGRRWGITATLDEHGVPVDHRAGGTAEVTDSGGSTVALGMAETQPGRFEAITVAAIDGVYPVRRGGGAAGRPPLRPDLLLLSRPSPASRAVRCPRETRRCGQRCGHQRGR